MEKIHSKRAKTSHRFLIIPLYLLHIKQLEKGKGWESISYDPSLMFMVADCLLSTKLDTADQHTSPQATPAANRQRFYVSRNMLFKTLIKKSAKSPERLLIIRIIFVSPPA